MEKEYTFDLSQYQLLQNIGKGEFGEVYKVKEIKTDLIFAAKISHTSFEEEQDNPNDATINIIREINIISKLNHPSIVKFIGFSPIDFFGSHKPVIITEYMQNGSLNDIIKLERKGCADHKWNITRKLITLYGIA